MAFQLAKTETIQMKKGQQWVCNEIDCDRRKYIQRLAYEIVDKSTLNIVALSENTFRFAVCKTKNSYKMSDAMSNFAPFFIWANSKRSFAINGNQLYLWSYRSRNSRGN